MDGALRRPSRRSCAISTTSPTASTCAATSSSTPGSPRRMFDEAAEPLAGPHRRRRRACTAQFVISGGRQPVRAQGARDSRRRDSFEGEVYQTGHWPHEGVDFTGKRVGDDRHRLERHPVHHRRSREQAGHLTVFQRTPNYAVPASQPPRRPDRGRRGQGRLRRDPRTSREPLPRRRRTRRCSRSALAVTRRGAAPRRSTSAGMRGGFRLFIDSFADILIDRARQRHHRRVHPRAHPRAGRRPRGRASCCPEGLPVRHQAPTARDQLLRGVQPGQRDAGRHRERADRSDHRDRRAHRGARVRARRDRARHRVRRHDRAADADGHRRSRRGEAAGQVGRRPAHLPRAVRQRIPEPVHHHRPAEPVACSTTCRWRSRTTSTSSPTRSGTCRQHAATTSSSRPRRPRTAGSPQHARSRQQTLLPGTDSWYMGANIPGKPRMCMVVPRRRPRLPGHLRRRGRQRATRASTSTGPPPQPPRPDQHSPERELRA